MIRIKVRMFTLSMLVILLLSSIFFLCCEKDETINFAGPNYNCDTNNVSFTLIIKPLIERNCKGCHNSSRQFAGIVLETYNDIKATAKSGKLVKSLYGSMRQYISNDCDIAKVQAWVNQGFLNN